MSFTTNGYELVKTVFSEQQLAPLKQQLNAMRSAQNNGGQRNAERKFSAVPALLCSSEFKLLKHRFLPHNSQLVRALLFVKSSQSNWQVSWHQDKTVCVTQRFDAKEWGPWSTKDGVLHVQPPLEVLNKTVAFRIHIDASTTANGCLNLIPGSHSAGLLSQDEINRYNKIEAVSCVAPVGSVLVMRPHILHASGKAMDMSLRRVLHLEFSSFKLPDGVGWPTAAVHQRVCHKA